MPTTGELAERIGLLERELGELRGMVGDQLAQSGGQTIDAAGHVAYDFAGHVHAAGLDLTAGDNDTPPADRRVRWLRAGDGFVVAEAFGTEGIFGNVAALQVHNDAAGERSFGSVSATSGTGGTAGGATVTAQAADGDIPSNAVIADALGQDRTVIRGDGASGFLQAGTPVAGDVIRGTVSAAGAVVRGEGFAVVRNTPGNYTITFAAAYLVIPAVVCSIGETVGPRHIKLDPTTARSTTQFRVQITDNANVAIDAIFDFIAEPIP